MLQGLAASDWQELFILFYLKTVTLVLLLFILDVDNGGGFTNGALCILWSAIPLKSIFYDEELNYLFKVCEKVLGFGCCLEVDCNDWFGIAGALFYILDILRSTLLLKRERAASNLLYDLFSVIY